MKPNTPVRLRLPRFARHHLRLPSWLLVLFAAITCASSATAGKIQYTYDSAGRLVAEDYSGGKVASYIYDPNGNLLTNATVISTSADVRIPSISSTAPGANAGGTVTYNITVNNNGPHPATGVVLTDTLPFGILFTSAGSSQGTCVITGRTVTCAIGAMLPGDTVTVSIGGIRALEGTFTNVAFVTSDIPDPNPNNNTNSVTVSATSPFDADGDDMPNWWETLHFGNNFGAQPMGDADGDGVTDFDEWIADTDPRDPTSKFEIASQVFESGAGEFSLTIHSSPIREYDLEFTEDMSDAFATVETVSGTGAPITFNHNSGTARGYYRVQVRIPGL